MSHFYKKYSDEISHWISNDITEQNIYDVSYRMSKDISLHKAFLWCFIWNFICNDSEKFHISLATHTIILWDVIMITRPGPKYIPLPAHKSSSYMHPCALFRCTYIIVWSISVWFIFAYLSYLLHRTLVYDGPSASQVTLIDITVWVK